MAFDLGNFLSRMGGDQPITPNMSGLGDLLRAGAQGQQGVPDQHTGMFGVHGTFRDVLGTLGDAMLMQAGRNPIYDPQRDQEKIGDAFKQYGFGTPEAMQAVAAVNPALAQQMYQQKAMDDLRQAGLGIRAQGVIDRGNHYGATDLSRVRTSVGGLLNTANADNYDNIYKVIDERLKRVGSSAEAEGIPATYDEQGVKDYARGTMTAKEQAAADAAAANASSNTTKAGAAVVSAKANKTRSDAYAAQTPSVIARNEATTNTLIPAQANRANAGAGYDRSRTKGGGAAAGTSPPLDPGKYKGKTATSPDGVKWVSDGTKWTKK